jgi:hypothetical protein
MSIVVRRVVRTAMAQVPRQEKPQVESLVSRLAWQRVRPSIRSKRIYKFMALYKYGYPAEIAYRIARMA